MRPDDAIVQFVAESGLFDTPEKVTYTPLPGGVSSDIWLAEASGQTVCVKRSLAQLRVPTLWEVSVERSRYEMAWYEAVSRVVPGAAPRVLAKLASGGIFAMEYFPPESFPLWKGLLMAGVVDSGFAARTGETLATIHAHFANDNMTRDSFDSDSIFHAIRMEPYLLHTASVHSDLSDQLGALAERTLQSKITLVHGDVSPKNILAGEHGPVFLDAECAWFGDPAFDVAFCLNHLLLKCIAAPQAADSLHDAFSALASAYLSRVVWESRAALERRVASLLPALLLGRIDGKSPIEYVTRERDQELIRDFARRFIASPPPRLDTIVDSWHQRIAHFAG